MRNSEDHRATRIAEDKSNDLALIKIQNVQTIPLALNLRPQWGGVAHVFGFPLSQQLSPNFTSGTITSLSIKNNSLILQISAPVQPGNSGGPILDDNGDVVGVVVARLSSVVAENVNFGIRSQVVDAFLHSEGIILPFRRPSNSIPFDPFVELGGVVIPIPAPQSGQKPDPSKIAEIAKTSSIKIYCNKVGDPNIFKVSCKMQDGPLKDHEMLYTIQLVSKTAIAQTAGTINSALRLKVVDATETKIRLAGEKWSLSSTTQLIYPVVDIDRLTMRIEASVWNQLIPKEPKPDKVVACRGSSQPIDPTCSDSVSNPSPNDVYGHTVYTSSGVCRRVN